MFKFGFIDKAGKLFVSRKNGDGYEDTRQYCKHDNKEQCGDWCPLFSEPEADIVMEMMGDDRRPYSIVICEERRLEFEKFEDQR